MISDLEERSSDQIHLRENFPDQRNLDDGNRPVNLNFPLLWFLYKEKYIVVGQNKRVCN